jgi:hypothetical protein
MTDWIYRSLWRINLDTNQGALVTQCKTWIGVFELFLCLMILYSPIDIYDIVHMGRSRDSVVGIETSYGLDDRGVRVRVPVGSRIFFSRRRSDRLWGPPNLLNKCYSGSFPEGKAIRE